MDVAHFPILFCPWESEMVPTRMLRAPIMLYLACVGALSACADSLPSEAPAPEESANAGEGAYLGHDVSADFEEFAADGKADALPKRFDQAWLMSDAFFTQADAITADDLQAFLEATPYDKRSWLADEMVGDLRAADAIVAAGQHQGINPVVLLARMQVEMGAISKSDRPSRRAVDFAFGCGCPDNRQCIESFRGLDKQMECAAEVMREHFDGSVAGTGQWRVGKSKRTLDRISVAPQNHATAALYSYTPWVLRGRGGNWLVWNVTRKFEQFFRDKGALSVPEGCLGAASSGLPPFVGAPCSCESDCGFVAQGQSGWCHPAGFCTIGCEGTCPDRSGYASTFCISSSNGALGGICASQASDVNGDCADLPGTLDRPRERYVGSSGASPRSAVVCVPAEDAFEDGSDSNGSGSDHE
ncbi:MAG: hypothetical protein ACE366_13465 [Bradymonadia bacterium]